MLWASLVERGPPEGCVLAAVSGECGGKLWTLHITKPRPGSVVVEHSPGMREVGGSIPGRVKQKTLKFQNLPREAWTEQGHRPGHPSCHPPTGVT